jgi:phage I-like protein
MKRTPHQIALLATHDLPPPSDAPAAPEWVHLLPGPLGMIRTGDGRGPYRVEDQARLIADSFAETDQLPIDENHATDLAAPRGEPAPARGWIVKMEARGDGIWGRVIWNSAGQALLADRAYRGISPVITHDKAGVIRSILRASLVNRPNLRGLTALNQLEQEDTEPMPFMDQLKEMLGLPASATEDDILAAIRGKSQGDAAMQSAIAEIGAALSVEGGETAAVVAAARLARTGRDSLVALQAQVDQLTAQLTETVTARKRAASETFIDGAIRDCRAGLNAGNRDQMIALHMTSPDAVEKLVLGMPKLGPTGAVAEPPRDGEIALNAEQRQVADVLGVPHDKYLETLKAEQKDAL